MQRPRHPLPARPDVTQGRSRPAQNAGTSAPTAYPATANASGGYPGYNAGAYMYNTSGGYPGYGGSGGYPYANASGGYPGYNASGGYPGYGGWTGATSAYAAAPSTAVASTSGHGGGHGGNRGRGRGGRRGDTSRTTPATTSTPGRSEEEERWAKSGRSAFIQGTGIRLETPEEIAAWIAERRRKFPTAERVAESKEEDEAARARGENPRKRKLDPARAAEEWGREAPPGPPVHDRGHERGRGGRGGPRGRGRGRGGASGGRPMVKPVDSGSSDSDSDSSDETSDDSDSDSDESDTSAAEGGGGDDDDDNTADDKTAEAEAEPAETKGEAEPGKVADAPADTTAAPDPEVCKFFARGKCRYGTRCRLAHVRGGEVVVVAESGKGGGGAPRPPAPRQPQPKRANPFARPSMLGALLSSPIENTLSQLTQTIRFLVANDMLRGVELRPGQAAEEESKRNRITVMPNAVAADSVNTSGEDAREIYDAHDVSDPEKI